MATATKKAAPAAKPAAKTAETTVETAAASVNAAADNAFAFSDAARGQYDAMLKSFNENAEELHGRTQEMFEAAREGFENVQTNMQSVGAEAMDAARQEMTDAVDFANELTRAKTIADALEIQRDYATRLFEARVDRFRTMTQTTVDAVRETVEPMSRTMTTAFGKAPTFTTVFPFASK